MHPTMLRSHCINQPQRKYRQQRNHLMQSPYRLRTNEIQGTHHYAPYQQKPPSLYRPTMQHIAIKKAQTTRQQERSRIKNVAPVGVETDKSIRKEVFLAQKIDNQRQSLYHPCPAFIVQQEYEKREKHIKQEYQSQKPSHTDYLHFGIRQQVKH